MRFTTSAARLFLLAVTALMIGSCSPSIQSARRASSAADVDAIEDSGKRLSGEFEAGPVEDVYRASKAQALPETVFRFDESGNFKRQDKSRTEEGAYLIGSNGEFVFYIEKVNGEQLAAARSERYMISDQSDDTFTLSSASKRLHLRRR